MSHAPPADALRDDGVALGQLFSPQVACSWVLQSVPLDPLFPEEQPLLSRAVPKRQREFHAGRHCARRALLGLGVAPVAILRSDNRAPLWPPGIVGSITHTGRDESGFAAAAVASTRTHRGVGLDAEQNTPLSDALLDRVLTANEKQGLSTLGLAPGIAGKLVFSAKEAFYKCQAPITGQFLDFAEVELAVDASRQSFRVHSVSRELDLELAQFRGRYTIGASLILSAVELLIPEPQ